MEYLVVLGFSALLALIPANIAKNKGYSYGAWWFYGWMLWIVAIIHVCLIPNKNTQQIPTTATAHIPDAGQSAAEELKKYNELKEQGIITEEEFRAKKDQILRIM